MLEFNRTMLQEKQLRRLYASGKSMMEISQILNCSVHKVSYWMEKHSIQRRVRREAMYIKLNPNGDPFKIKTNLNKNDAFLLGLGLGIYWGEGNKVTPHSLRVANTDPEMIKAFTTFLKKICNLENKRLSYNIVSFNDASPEVARKYWSEQLKISPQKFGKITQIPHQGKGTYKRKSQYGVCTIQGNNIKLKTWIMEQITSINSKI